MKIRDFRSANVDDRRRMGRRAVAGGGGVVAVVLLAAAYVFPDIEPVLRVIGLDRPQPGATAPATLPEDEVRAFVSATLAYTEEVWTDAFEAGAFEGTTTYEPATLVLYTGRTGSACGQAMSEIGPFYCPADDSIYIDPSFYAVMAQELRAPGDFAQAYVIAHEVAHHVQKVNGVLPTIMRQRMAASELEGNRLTVRLELQADCYSGVWAKRADERFQILESGDVQEALRAAFQVGDDVLQRMSGAPVDPDAFTHGSAIQRSKWFQTGFDTGAIDACDTFTPAYEDL